MRCVLLPDKQIPRDNNKETDRSLIRTDGVPHSGVRFEHRCYYWDRYIRLDTTTHLGHKEWTAVYGGRHIPSAASQGRRIVRSRFHRGALFNSTVF